MLEHDVRLAGVRVLAVRPSEDHELEHWLSDEERAHASQIADPILRAEWRSGRALARHAIAQACGAEFSPRHVRFTRSPSGRPSALLPARAPRVSYSVSRSPGLVGCAVSTEATIGLDVERIDRVAAPLGIAERFFPPSEFALLAAQEEPQRSRSFTLLWAAKEALAKALGVGVHQLPADCTLDFDASGAPQLCGRAPRTASVLLTIASADHVGVLAISGTAARLDVPA